MMMKIHIELEEKEGISSDGETMQHKNMVWVIIMIRWRTITFKFEFEFNSSSGSINAINDEELYGHSHQTKRKYKPQKHHRPEQKPGKQSGGDEEYESEEIQYLSSEPDYIDVDQENYDRKRPHQVKEQQNNPKTEDEKPGAYGMGMEIQISQPIYPGNASYEAELQPGNFQYSSFTKSNVLQQNPVVNQYIQQQAALINAAHLKQMEEEKERQMEQYEIKNSIQQQHNDGRINRK